MEIYPSTHWEISTNYRLEYTLIEQHELLTTNILHSETETLTPSLPSFAGSPRRSSTASLVISVADDNDSPPVFDRSRYVAVVNEDALPRTAIMTLMTSDEDLSTDPVHFYITAGDPHAQFEVRRSPKPQ